MLVFKLSSFQDRENANLQLADKAIECRAVERDLSQEKSFPFTLPGYSYTAGSDVNFSVDKNSAGYINWRESLICPVTGLINRWRAVAHLFELECKPLRESNIYISEFVSPLYRYLKSIYPNLIGSEYLGDQLEPGEVRDGIRHEDLTNLSFEDESLDYCLSFDCFEHMPNPSHAFNSCYAKLKKGGALFWSVPFSFNLEKNQQRAKKDEDGNIVHLMVPEYHGDPLNQEGILCFNNFGWEMLDQIRDVGFKDTYALLYWSKKYGYLGAFQSAFFAFK